jgi:Tol biopolymer transport system component
MTAFDRFDPFEQRITAAIDEIAAARRPEYLGEILAQTAQTSQRPRWTFPGRWLPAAALRDRWAVVRMPSRPLLLVLLALLLAAAIGAAIVGSLTRGPSPFGLADNGLVGYATNGDLYVRDSLSTDPRLIIGSPDPEIGPWFSPDGRRFLFIRTTDGRDHLWVARADGSDVRPVLSDILVASNWAWAPDSRTIAVVNDVNGVSGLSLIDTETGRVRPMDLGAAAPLPDLAFRPPDGSELLVRVATGTTGVDFAIVPVDGGEPRLLGLRSEMLFGQQWENSGPVWSLDGERIAYNRVERDPETGYEHFRVYTVRPDGSDDIPIPGPPQPRIHEAWPTYSPDGASILVHRWTWNWEGGGAGWIAVLPADGSRSARNIGPRVPGGQDTGLSKTWAPDGTRVLLRAENTRQVFSVDPVTNEWERLPWTEELPDWQRVRR